MYARHKIGDGGKLLPEKVPGASKAPQTPPNVKLFKGDPEPEKRRGSPAPRKEAPIYGHLLSELFAEKDYRPATASSIRCAVARFESMGLTEFTADAYATYYRLRAEAGKAVDTIDKELARIRTFDKWLKSRSAGSSGKPVAGKVVVFAEALESYSKVRNHSPQTRRTMRTAVGHFERMGFVTLDTDSLASYREQRAQEGVSPDTCRGELGKLTSFGRWLGEKPELRRPYAIKRAPKAWNREELSRLFAEADSTKRHFAHIPGHLWWGALLRTCYASGERIGALLSVTWSDVDWEAKTLLCKAEYRKGQRSDLCHPLDDDCMAALKALRAFLPEPATTPIFGNRATLSGLYKAFGTLLADAKLPNGRRDRFHKLRRTLATEVVIAGGDATQRLGHASDAQTRGAYIDARAYRQVEPWRPGQPEVEKPAGWLGRMFKSK